jgi:O-6-methylguanine DNA methyltransferase
LSDAILYVYNIIMKKLHSFVRQKLSYAIFQTSCGWMGVVISNKGLCQVILPQFLRDNAFQAISNKFASAELQEDNTLPIVLDLISYMNGQKVDFNYPLDLPSISQFQQDIRQATRSIPYGQTRSYSQIAQDAGHPGAYRAVGQVMACNPVPIVIPCHRVVASDGSLHGFRGGLEMKQRLIQMEQLTLKNSK